ncbi:hypothetical protein LXN10_13200 [Arcobacter sp. KX21116]|uniref:hypothetical protein n=1 Tax=Arcobacter iocasae TaxID=2906515 RepID=UPI0035D4ABAD
MENKKLTFHIDNMAYSINVDPKLEMELTKFLSPDRSHTTKELLYAYLCKAQEHYTFKEEVEKISNKLPKLS